MSFEVVLKFVHYITHVIKGLFEIAVGKEDYIFDANGKVISKLPSKRKQVLVFAKNFLKDPVSKSSINSFIW